MTAARFLEPLARTGPVTFQTFSDRDELKTRRPDGTVYDPNARILHGTLLQHRTTLESLNAEGAGVYVMVNQGDGRGRRSGNVVRVRALFIDTDGAPFPLEPPLKPHLVAESSPGRWHLYWLVDGLELGDFSTLQEAFAEHYGTDPSVKDLPRVMRLPGFYHCKAEPVMVQLLEAHDHAPYRPADLFAAWPSLPERLEAEHRAKAEIEAQRDAILTRAAERKKSSTCEDGGRAKALLQGHHDRVAAALPGVRHSTLLRSARTLGGYVAGGLLEPQDAQDVLTAAAGVCGLPEPEAAAVVRWGLAKGVENPLELEERPKPVQTSVTAAKGVARFFADKKRSKPDPCKAVNGVWGRAHRGLQ